MNNKQTKNKQTKRIKQPKIMIETDKFESQLAPLCYCSDTNLIKLGYFPKNMGEIFPVKLRNKPIILHITPFEVLINSLTHEFIHAYLNQAFNKEVCRKLDALVDNPNWNSLEYGF
jgi:hypothetical protein